MFHQMLLMNQFMLEINPSFDLSINCDWEHGQRFWF
jgi:hypothetical protein